MNKLPWCILLALTFNLHAASAQTPYNEKYSADDLISGPAAISEAQCAEKPNSVWVRLGWMNKGCIRYFPSDDVGTNKNLIIYLDGDNISPQSSASSNLTMDQFRARYESNTYASMISYANATAKKLNAAFIFLARPGTYGSTGANHQSLEFRLSRTEPEFINAAIDLIKARYGYERINVVGQSAGGGIVAALLTMGRQDIKCAVMASGASSVVHLLRDRNQSVKLVPFDPLSDVASIKPDPDRWIIAVSDRHDSLVSFASQSDFINEAVRRGHQAIQLEAHSSDTHIHHGLRNEGFQATKLCIQNMPIDSIGAQLAK